MTAAERLPGLAVSVERDLECRMRDGIVLRADVFRPAEGGSYPVLLLRTPYGKTTAQSDAGYAHPSWYARHGYVVAVQDTRGRWGSEGQFWPFRDEAQDGHDSVEWAATLSGGDGRVALIGYSYAGAAQLLAAMSQPPSLAAICPAFTALPGDGWFRRGGAFALAFARSWALDLAREDARRRADEAALAAIDAGDDGAVEAHAPYFREWLEDSAPAEWQLERIAVPCLHIGGWWDVFVAESVEIFRRLSEARSTPQKLLVGPWRHEPWYAIETLDPSAGATSVDDWQLRWLDHVLKGDENGVLHAPATIYVDGHGWRDLDAWPPAGAHGVDWFLHSGGRANSADGDGTLSPEPPSVEAADVYVYDPAYPAPSAGGHTWCDSTVFPAGPECQSERERSKAVLVYTSDPLSTDLELVGNVTLTLFAASSVVDTDFAARLCLVDEIGTSTNVQEGIVRARYRDSLSTPSLIEPNHVYEYTIQLGPVAVRVPERHRLRLSVSSSDFPMWDRNLNSGEPPGREGLIAAVVATQVVLHSGEHPSRLSLPSL